MAASTRAPRALAPSAQRIRDYVRFFSFVACWQPRADGLDECSARCIDSTVDASAPAARVRPIWRRSCSRTPGWLRHSQGHRPRWGPCCRRIGKERRGGGTESAGGCRRHARGRRRGGRGNARLVPSKARASPPVASRSIVRRWPIGGASGLKYTRRPYAPRLRLDAQGPPHVPPGVLDHHAEHPST